MLILYKASKNDKNIHSLSVKIQINLPLGTVFEGISPIFIIKDDFIIDATVSNSANGSWILTSDVFRGSLIADSPFIGWEWRHMLFYNNSAPVKIHTPNDSEDAILKEYFACFMNIKHWVVVNVHNCGNQLQVTSISSIIFHTLNMSHEDNLKAINIWGKINKEVLEDQEDVHAETIKSIQYILLLDHHHPISGICLSNQLLLIENGAKTYMLKYGAMNQLFIDFQTVCCYITPQHEFYAIDLALIPPI